MNEIQTKYAPKVWKNIDFMLRTCQHRILILLMEPSVPKARPRVDWLKAQLAQSAEVVHELPEEEIFFNNEPTIIGYEGTGIGLNDRLFGSTLAGSKPAALQKSIKRTHIAALVKPKFPVPESYPGSGS